MPQASRLRPSQRVASRRSGGRLSQERHGFGLLAFDFAPQQGTLGGQREAGLLRSEGSALERAGFVAAFVAFAGAGQRRAFGAHFLRPARLASALGSLREKRQPAVPERAVRWSPAPSAGCP